jgi:hypothetical protein
MWELILFCKLVLRECAQEPLQIYLLKSAANFLWNKMVDFNSNTLPDVMKADILGILVLLIVGPDRWRQDAFGDMQNGAIY